MFGVLARYGEVKRYGCIAHVVLQVRAVAWYWIHDLA